MSKLHDVVLELVRPGPAHNQLLSPLTPYVALCGGGSPATVHIPFEHKQLLTRIERLRYELENSNGADIQISQRQAELQDMGKTLGEVLADIPSLLAEISQIQCDGGELTHLRLSLSASELALVPFETALSPAGFPGSGSPLLLQTNMPISLTREIRRGLPLPLQWDRTPRILFAFASPIGLAPVPAEAHLRAIREAINPWVKIKQDSEESVQEISEILTVLPDASLRDIRDECERMDYTHVHILAHGAPFDHAGDRRYGIALNCNHDKTKWEVIDGESLAIALSGKRATGSHTPSVVSLATCDSGNIGSVLSPGGSIAHELHAAGIPWIFASQFPLWMKASTLAVNVLFRGLLEGEDPRSVVHKLRHRLRTDCPNTHDWASIVAYASTPPDFEEQLSQFRDRQTKGKLVVLLDRLDDLFGSYSQDSPPPAIRTNMSERERVAVINAAKVEIGKRVRVIATQDARSDVSSLLKAAFVETTQEGLDDSFSAFLSNVSNRAGEISGKALISEMINAAGEKLKDAVTKAGLQDPEGVLETTIDKATKIDTRASLEDAIINAADSEKLDELEEISVRMRDILARWRREAPDNTAQRLKPISAYRLGMSGANEKRLGIAYQLAGEEEKSLNAYKASRDYYCQSIEADTTSTWSLTQYLSMHAILVTLFYDNGRTPLGRPTSDWWFTAVHFSKGEVSELRDAFALTNLVELSILGCFYSQDGELETTRIEIGSYIAQILQLQHKDHIPGIALHRQLCRYRDFWSNPLWDGMVKHAISELTRGILKNRSNR